MDFKLKYFKYLNKSGGAIPEPNKSLVEKLEKKFQIFRPKSKYNCSCSVYGDFTPAEEAQLLEENRWCE